MTAGLSEESLLCTRCGLCCMGALHHQAALDADEVKRAASLGLPVREGSARPVFALPCPKLERATCTIYDQRPRVCPRYACRLLEQVREGRDLSSAMAVVAEAQRLGAEMREVLGGDVTYPGARTRLEAGSCSPPELLTIIAFNTYIDRHFRNSDEGPILNMELC